MVAGHLRVQNGYWQMILSYKDSTGKRRTKSVTTHLKEKGNKRRAEAMLLDLRRAFTKEQHHDLQNGPMFSNFMRDWLAQIRPTVAPTTFASYCRVVEQSIIPYFEERQITLQTLTTGDITNYYDWLLHKGLSSTSVLRHHANIHTALEKAVALGLIEANPARQASKPRRADFLPQTYSAEEASQLLNLLHGQTLELPVALALVFGLRRSEVLGLRWEALDLDRRLLSIRCAVTQTSLHGKSKVHSREVLKRKASYRTLPIPENILPLLHRYQRESGWLCLNENGVPFRPDQLSRHFQSFLQKNNLRKIRFHDLRHSCAGILISSGVPLLEVQQWLGHSTYQTTADLYVHLDFSTKLKRSETINTILEKE